MSYKFKSTEVCFKSVKNKKVSEAHSGVIYCELEIRNMC